MARISGLWPKVFILEILASDSGGSLVEDFDVDIDSVDGADLNVESQCFLSLLKFQCNFLDSILK